MAGTYTMLKGSNPPWMPTAADLNKEGSFYYVQGGSVATYKKASVLITLPTSKRLKYSGYWGRNAYIAIGVDGGTAGAIDIGIRNCSRDESGNYAPDGNGLGWEAFCYECKIDNLHPTSKAPAGTVRAKVEVTPNLTYTNKITLYVQWLDGNNSVLGTFNNTFTLKQTYNWTVFYRFASLVTNDPNATMNDSTYMSGGTFETAYLGSTSNTNWGINSSPVTVAWIVNPPKCSVPYKWDVGEQFKIDYWA